MSPFSVLMSKFFALTAVIVAIHATTASKISELSKMSHEEVNKLFEHILPEIDIDQDGFISEEEVVAHNERKFLQTLKAAATAEFANLDKNGDNKISPEELASSLSSDVKGEELKKRFDRSDKDSDGFLSIDEVVAIMMGSDMDASVYTEFLTAHDLNKDGKLTVEELLHGFTEEEKKENGSDVNEAFNFADADKDGFLSTTEIKTLLDAATQGSAGSVEQRKAYFMEEAKQVLNGKPKLSVDKIDVKAKMVLLAELFDSEARESAPGAGVSEGKSSEGLPSDLEKDILRFQKEMMAAGEKNPMLDPSSDSFDVEKFLAELKTLVDTENNGAEKMIVLDENNSVMGKLSEVSGDDLVGDALKETGVRFKSDEL
eukprot:GDKJ01064151.1.p1 GENE.GDKJ01064151.1~~GDKJ01064151.1.p1  ORF type:complete len:373 (+),score=115.34 GDKJ01064151.1:3-1121(+)